MPIPSQSSTPSTRGTVVFGSGCRCSVRRSVSGFDAELGEAISQKPNGPAGAACRRLRAGHCNEVRFGDSVDLGRAYGHVFAHAERFCEALFEALFDEAPPDARAWRVPVHVRSSRCWRSSSERRKMLYSAGMAGVGMSGSAKSTYATSPAHQCHLPINVNLTEHLELLKANIPKRNGFIMP